MTENNLAIANVNNAVIESLNLKDLRERMIKADVLRLDKIHPVVSGNKWFKLKYYLEDARNKGYGTILTFGGAWSNHIIATAYAAKYSGFGSIGIIRGDKPSLHKTIAGKPIELSQTLESALNYGMQLEFVNRLSYARKEEEEFINDLKKKYGKIYIIPEGGAGEEGVRGSREILSLAGETAYTHIMCCIGTGTMFTGLIQASLPTQQVIGIPVLKGLEAQQEKLLAFIEPAGEMQYGKNSYDYHFGGYARKTPELLHFMNSFYEATGIPTDFVYTGKLLYAFIDLVKKGYFAPGSRILVIHSGGLQGNASLPDKTLLF